jgi:hypothetical protein
LFAAKISANICRILEEAVEGLPKDSATDDGVSVFRVGEVDCKPIASWRSGVIPDSSRKEMLFAGVNDAPNISFNEIDCSS